jgi:insulysin
LLNDITRLGHLESSLSNPEHPYHKFVVGNLQTLRDNPQRDGINLRDRILAFFESQYSANLMKLVLRGKESLDQLKEWVETLFSAIPNKNLAQNRWDPVQPYTPNQLCKQIFAKRIMDYSLLRVYFPFPEEDHEALPNLYVCRLMDYKGPGGILSYVKEKNWGRSLSASTDNVCPGSAILIISVGLTKDGLTHYREIITVIFQYIAMAKETGPQGWRTNEMNYIAIIKSQSRPKMSAFDFTRKVSAKMLSSHPRESLLHDDISTRFDDSLISKSLSCLRSDNFKFMVAAKQSSRSGFQKEHYYGTEYTEEEIPQDFLGKIKEALTSSHRIEGLHLPYKNIFIPKQLWVPKANVQPTKVPKLIRVDDDVRLWYKKDDQFWPWNIIYFTLRNPLVEATPANEVKADMYCALLMNSLSEKLEDAHAVGMEFLLTSTSYGVHVRVEGYSESVSKLLDIVLQTMNGPSFDHFKEVKENVKSMYSLEGCPPYRRARIMMNYLVAGTQWTYEQYAAELEHIDANDIKNFFPRLLRENYIEALMHGNLSVDDALRIASRIENAVHGRSPPQWQWPVHRNVNLPPGSNYTYQMVVNDNNKSIEYYLFIGMIPDYIARAKLLLLSQVLREPLYDQLRNQEKLGYRVWGEMRASETNFGYSIVIQGQQSPQYLEERIEKFLEHFLRTLDQMKQDEFKTHQDSIINKLLKKFENLQSESSHFWAHIEPGDFEFLAYETIAGYIRSLTLAELIAFYQQHINPTSDRRAKIAVHVNGQPEETPLGVSMITNVPKFKDEFSHDLDLVRDLSQFYV